MFRAHQNPLHRTSRKYLTFVFGDNSVQSLFINSLRLPYFRCGRNLDLGVSEHLFHMGFAESNNDPDQHSNLKQTRVAYIFCASSLLTVSKGRSALKKLTAALRDLAFRLFSYIAKRLPIHVKRSSWTWTTNVASSRRTIESCAPRIIKQETTNFDNAIVCDSSLAIPSSTRPND